MAIKTTFATERDAATGALRLLGPIDEYAPLPQVFEGGGELRLDCRGVTRINSMGVKAWIKCVRDAIGRGSRITIDGLSPPLAEQANLIANFLQGIQVTSALLPYRCTKCGADFGLEKTLAELRQEHRQPPTAPCPKCAGTSEFDDVVEEFFGFLTRG